MLQAQFLGKTANLLAHSCKQLDLMPLEILFSSTPLERKIHLLDNVATDEILAIVPVISAFGASSKSPVTTVTTRTCTYNSHLSVHTLPMQPDSKNIWYRLRYLNSDNGNGVMTGASRVQQWFNAQLGCVDTSQSYDRRNGLFCLSGIGKTFGGPLNSDMTGAQVVASLRVNKGLLKFVWEYRKISSTVNDGIGWSWNTVPYYHLSSPSDVPRR